MDGLSYSVEYLIFVVYRLLHDDLYVWIKHVNGLDLERALCVDIHGDGIPIFT